MKTLFLTVPEEEYLSDQALIGLRELLGESCVDYPRKDVLYSDFDQRSREQKLYGNGFTIWKTLEPIEIDRSNIIDRIRSGEFDLIIFGAIWRQVDLFEQYLNDGLIRGNSWECAVLDGEDMPNMIEPLTRLLPYFKRELFTGDSSAKPIGFAIPPQKIRTEPAEKRKLFAKHVQCDEAYRIAEIQNNCVRSYAFESEREYYADIAESKYGITMKKGGWECMRHYEIAANGTVPCFYQLNQKPETCAPHGLVDMENCIGFETAEELIEKIGQIEQSGRYETVRENAVRWVNDHTTTHLARSILDGID